jgi:hypothetical protein
MLSKSRKLLLTLFLLHFVLLSGQKIYSPIKHTQNNNKEKFLNQFNKRYKDKQKNVSKKFSGKQEKILKEMYKYQYTSIEKSIQKGELYFNKDINGYLYQILENIISKNPQLKKYKYYLYFSRDNSPNAFSIGDGTIIIHLDLLNYLNTEGELASILTHEIAHYIINHRDKSYEKYAKKITSKEFKKEKKKVYKSRYGRQERAKNLIKKTVYSRRYKSRKHELEADSLGMILFSKTDYSPIETINSLKILSDVDIEKDSLDKDFLIKIFTTKTQKFNPDWLFMEDFSDYEYKKEKDWLIDSLKTHPNMDIRISKLKKLIEKLKIKDKEYSSSFYVNQKKFNELKKIAPYEKISNYYLFEDYGTGLYYTLKQMKKHPDDKFYLKMFYLFFEKLTSAKKEMALSRYIPPYKPNTHTDSQKLFINFMYNLKQSEMERILKDYKRILRQKNINLKY